MEFSEKKEKVIYVFTIVILVSISLASLYFIKESGIFGFVTLQELEPSDVVLNLTFDDENDPWKDYSYLNHQFNARGSASWADSDVCKWFGCADLTATDGSDYLNSSTLFEIGENGFCTMWWTYEETSPSGSSSRMYWMVGNDDESNELYCTEGDYGISTMWSAELGDVGGTLSESYGTTGGTWTHYAISYDGHYYSAWKNNILLKNVSTEKGTINSSAGNPIKIGVGRYGIDVHGYIDELLFINNSCDSSMVDEQYYQKSTGTPPDLDLYVQNITYTLPFDFSDSHNSLADRVGDTMPIYITIRNQGITASGNFNWELELNDEQICGGRISVSSQSQTTLICDWPSSLGFHEGYVTIDTSNEIIEDIEENNNQKIYVPFMDRPWFHFNLTEFEDILKPYCSIPSNAISYSSCNWINSFNSEDFSQSWTGNSVDPRAKKGRENAMGCMFDDYPPESTQCIRARNHLFGWANRTVTSYDNVQAIHELAHVGIIFDIMFPSLSEPDLRLLAHQYHDICQQITNIENTRPDRDDTDAIKGGNGNGFGSGMGGFCYTLLGADNTNPTLIQRLDDQYWGTNIASAWMNREDVYLMAYKNDPWANYQEGWLYKTYSSPHLVENVYFRKRFNLGDINQYNNAFCAMAREVLSQQLDFNYNGNTLRNDEGRSYRSIQRGDSNSYQEISDGNFVNWDLILYYGALCNDIETKESILWYREKIFNMSGSNTIYPTSYLFKQIEQDIESLKKPEATMPKIIFDNANDILTIRTNYTYSNDNVIQIDGGEERGSGHSQAQGYYLYALGEPFIDLEQVPYEDDVRAETWKNGISLLDDTQTNEGESSFYSASCGTARLNQYYGMYDCPSAYYSTDYPSYRRFPLQYGGDLANYMGTSDARLAGVYVWRPYKNAAPVQEYFIKYGDTLAKRTVVEDVTQGEGIYHNFININNEYDESRSGTTFTFNRIGTTKNLKTQVIYISYPDLSLGGGETGLKICFCKTSCDGSCGGTSNYRRMYYYTPSDNLDMIFTHHWYTTGNEKAITAINLSDKGILQSGNYIFFDSDNNNEVTYSDKTATGWGLVFNDNENEIGAFNTTFIQAAGVTLFESVTPLSALVKVSPDSITLETNSFTDIDNDGYDYSLPTEVTIDCRDMTLNSNFAVRKDGEIISSTESGTKVTFTVDTTQNGDAYIITGGETIIDETAPVITSIANTTVTDNSFFMDMYLNESGNASFHAFTSDLMLDLIFFFQVLFQHTMK
ncbi:MAG: hypothetical protein KKF44_07030 [Nanoarchaeota archaeon]|nr:hypothetical protein [Nanoarchaeota archaeon]